MSSSPSQEAVDVAFTRRSADAHEAGALFADHQTPPTADDAHDRAFDFQEAFARTIGWVNEAELATLRAKRVAIAGLGGVGGSHLLTLTRLGVGQFHIADLDSFELPNFNRQAGASMSTIGCPKVDVLARMAGDINPTARIQRFPDGVNADTVDAFLDGVHLYVDSLDFFAVEARRLVFDACARKNIPAITAAPLGMSTALLCFMPGHMTFEQYFRLEGCKEEEQLLRFMVGLAPRGLHRASLVDPSAVDLARHQGPSTPMGIDLCAGVVGSTALKILLGRGKVLPAPHGIQFDAYRNRFTHTWRPWGNRNPLHQLILFVARRAFAPQARELLKAKASAQAGDAGPGPGVGVAKGSDGRGPSDPDLRNATGPASSVKQSAADSGPTSPAVPAASVPQPLAAILDAARWAPSGDNAQPWRFEVRSDRHVIIHAHDTRDDCVYDRRGWASQLAHGALLETLSIAASAHGFWARVERQDDPQHPHHSLFDVRLEADHARKADPLLPYLAQRTTQRRAMKPTPIGPEARTELESAAGDCDVRWHSTFGSRWDIAWLLFRSAHIRLTIPEGYQTHRDAIEWRARFSIDRMPDQAVGLNPLTTRLMRVAMKSWKRVSFMNRFLAGTLAPRLELDVMPGLRCGAHVALLAAKPPTGVDDFVAAGRSVQRFWLQATALGLHMQPEMTPLIFRQYVRTGVEFTQVEKARQAAGQLADRFDALFGREAADRMVFLARLGRCQPPLSRSLRLPLERLLVR